MTDHSSMLETGPQTVLYIGDTVTSPLRLFKMELEDVGLSITPAGGTKSWIHKGCLGVESCELTAAGLVIAAKVTGWEYQVTAFTPYGLAVEDSGLVVIYNANGSAQQQMYPPQGDAALRLSRHALDELHAKIHDLEKRARIESGYPGPIEKKKPTGT